MAKLTYDQIREALRPLCKDETTLDMLLETSMDEYRTIEAAVLAEAAKDREDAARYRWLRDNDGCKWHIGVWADSPWGDFNVACGEPNNIDAAIDAARGKG